MTTLAINTKTLKELSQTEVGSRKYHQLRTKLIQDNKGLVYRHAKKAKNGQNLTPDDMQNAYVGLIETINKHDPKKAASIGALGFYRIRHNMYRYGNKPVGIKIPKYKLSECKFTSCELIEDKITPEIPDCTDDWSQSDWLNFFIDEVITDPTDNAAFKLKCFTKTTYKQIAFKFGMDRKDFLMKYRNYFNKVVKFGETYNKKQEIIK